MTLFCISRLLLKVVSRLKRIVKRERTNHATGFETLESIDATMSIDDAMQEFLLMKQAQRSAPRTISDYRKHFEYLKRWLNAKYPEIRLSQITSAILHEYIAYLSGEKLLYDDHPRRYKTGVNGLSPMTVNVRIRTLRAFLNWCYRSEYIRINVASTIKLQKVDNDRIMAFTTDQVKQLLEAPDRKSFAGFRDYVVIMVLLDTGLRISELFSLRHKDVDFSTLVLTVPWEKAKTRKTRSVPISKVVGRLLADLIQENSDFGPKADMLFYSSVGTPMSPESFDERLRQYGKQAGITGVRVSAHTFRHTFAVHWIKNGGDPFSLQKILGHTDMAMVRRYVRLSDTDVKSKHNQFSPIHTFLTGKTKPRK